MLIFPVLGFGSDLGSALALGLFPDLTAARLVIWRAGYDVTTLFLFAKRHFAGVFIFGLVSLTPSPNHSLPLRIRVLRRPTVKDTQVSLQHPQRLGQAVSWSNPILGSTRLPITTPPRRHVRTPLSILHYSPCLPPYFHSRKSRIQPTTPCSGFSVLRYRYDR